jgi:hypothetical protein
VNAREGVAPFTGSSVQKKLRIQPVMLTSGHDGGLPAARADETRRDVPKRLYAQGVVGVGNRIVVTLALKKGK